MATAAIAINQYVLPNEGYFANVTGDVGGETYAGITKTYNPEWQGWGIVDSYVAQKGGLQNMQNNERIPGVDFYVNDFYQNLWSQTMMDYIKDQNVANILFDFIVNSGVKTAVKHVQKIVGVTVDGIIGPNTIAAINGQDPVQLFNAIKEDRASFYTRLANEYQNDKQFLSGWLNRLSNFTASNPVVVAGSIGSIFLIVALLGFLTLKK